MPVDRKRINGPENTLPYQLCAKLNTKSLKQQFRDLFKSDEHRKDSRTNLEPRKIFLETGIVSQAKGSAYIEVNHTKVIVSVFDPREIPNRNDYSLKGTIYCEFKYAPFSCPKRRLHQQDAEEKLGSALMKQALESIVCRHEFPNLQVDVYALVLHNDGSALSAAITAAGVALTHAGIPMYGIITSATVAVQGKHKLLDPTLEEMNLCSVPSSNDKGGKRDDKKDSKDDTHGMIILTYMEAHDQVSQIYQTGYLGLDDMKEGINILKKACKDIIPLIQKCVVKYVYRTATTNGENIED